MSIWLIAKGEDLYISPPNLGFEDLVNYLIEKRAVTSARSDIGTPLEMAQMGERAETGRLLSEKEGESREGRAKELLSAVKKP